MLGSPAGPGGPAQRGLWPLAPAPIPGAANFSADGYGKYGLYSLLQGNPTFGSALYSHNSAISRFATAPIQPTPSTAFHAAAHKVSDSFFASTGYTFGAPTPPPGSPYSPVPVTQLEVLTKGLNSNIIIQQHQQQAADYQASKKRLDAKQLAADEQQQQQLAVGCCMKPCCSCSPVKSKFLSSGCSRTNPIEWNPVAIKKEPGAATPCQVAEVTTSGSPLVSATIKVEAASPTQKTCVSNVCHAQQLLATGGGMCTLPSVVTNNGNIPVGIAVARQRMHQLQEVVTSSALPPLPSIAASAGLLTTVNATQIKDARISELVDPGMAAANGTAGVAGGGTLLQFPADDRAGGFASWPVGGAHNSALTTPTLWQYPAHLPMEPLVPMPVPMPPVGFQLVRDHNTGGLLLLPTAGVEQMQQVVWPSYHQTSPHLLLPPSLPPPPLQLLGSSSDYLQTSTTLHQHTQTHSTRLLAVTTDKRKLPLSIPATTLIKIESEMDQSKALQAMSTFDNSTGTVYTDPSMGPLVTTHVIYQHPSNFILSQATAPTSQTEAITVPTATCRSQATSPVACLTPPPEGMVEVAETDVQDASNQTDASECELHDTSKEDVPPAPPTDELLNSVPEPYIQHYDAMPVVKTEEVEKTESVEQEISEESPQEQENYEPAADMECTRDDLIMEEQRTAEKANESLDPVVDERAALGSPDISGLELLSNSIVEFERTHTLTATKAAPVIAARTNEEVLERIAQMTLTDKPALTAPPVLTEDLGGLNLLCALAEQRFMEESKTNPPSTDCVTPDKASEERPKKRKSHSECETRQKKQLKICDKQGDDKKSESSVRSCMCRDESYRTYKTKESEKEAKKFLASKKQSTCCNSDWPCMNAMELDMRIRLADLQRKYREKQMELSKLKPKKHEKWEHRSSDRKAHRSRKKSTPERITSSPPPDKINGMPYKQLTSANKSADLLKPPKLCPYGELETRADSNPIRQYESPQSSPHHDKSSKSSKKRKVGRPKKLLSTTGLRAGTETIVAKKPKKGNLFGYLLAAKARLIQNNAATSDPPRFVEDSDSSTQRKKKRKKSKARSKHKAKASQKIHVNTESDDDLSDTLAENNNSPIQQAAIKTDHDNADGHYEEEASVEEDEEEEEYEPEAQSENNSDDEVVAEKKPRLDADTVYQNGRTEFRHTEQSAVDAEEDIVSTTQTSVVDDDEPEAEPDTEDQGADCDGEQSDQPPHEEQGNEAEAVIDECAKLDSRCTLQPALLEQDKLRVLTAMGGLFYAGQLNAVEPPDVYSITLDGERGNRPHIMSREEILRDAIVEVSPTSLEELPPGTRLCAYWSQQYRCLYPGSVADPDSPNSEADTRFVAVEFDDGDNGRIAIEDIRLLPEDYPIIEYDPNPLLSLSKKRRRASAVEERRSTTAYKSPSSLMNAVVESSTPDEKNDANKIEREKTSILNHKERKKLKKKKREKLRQRIRDNGKRKKKKKHRCVEEYCKHRKHHKKHRKHHKKHHHSKKGALVGAESITMQAPDANMEESNDASVNEDDEIDEPTSVRTSDPEDFYVEYHIVPNVENQVTMEDLRDASTQTPNKRFRERQESCESRSKMSAFLPARQLWGWSGKGYKRPKTKGRSRKQFYRAIERGTETIQVGDSAVFLSTGRPDRPYIGKIEAMWEACGTMVVKVRWFYHPEETVGCPPSFKYPGALFESPHVDENDVQTISHKCEVLTLKDYTAKLGEDPQRYANIYDNNDIYYLAGHYDPTAAELKMEAEIPLNESNDD